MIKQHVNVFENINMFAYTGPISIAPYYFILFFYNEKLNQQYIEQSKRLG